MFRSRWTTGIIGNNLSMRNVFAARDQARDVRSYIYTYIYIRERGAHGASRIPGAFLLHGHLCPVKISISAEHSIAIAMRLFSFRRLSLAGELSDCNAHALRATGGGTNGSRRVFISCRDLFADIVTRKVGECIAKARASRRKFAGRSETNAEKRRSAIGLKYQVEREGGRATSQYRQLRDEYRSIMPGILSSSGYHRVESRKFARYRIIETRQNGS